MLLIFYMVKPFSGVDGSGGYEQISVMATPISMSKVLPIA